jgi:FeS assembly SUF system regulator
MIRLGRLTDYAVTLLTQMVSEDGRVWAAPDLADKTGLPVPTVSKILKQLTKSEIVTAQRGASGGYRLARPSPAISVADIVEAMDGPIALTDCSDGSDHSCRVESVCPMSGGWNKINQAVRRALEDVSLADMAGQPSMLIFNQTADVERSDIVAGQIS